MSFEEVNDSFDTPIKLNFEEVKLIHQLNYREEIWLISYAIIL